MSCGPCLRLYTIQPSSLVPVLLQEGRLLAKPEFGEHGTPEGWRGAYAWLAQQMRDRLPATPEAAKFPFWAWHSWNGAKQAKPDLRYSSMRRWGAGARRYVLLELDVPWEEALLSDFEAWHWVLNYWYFGAARETGQFERDLKKRGMCYWKQKPLPDMHAHARLTQTWERIFELRTAAALLGTPRKSQQVQATFWELRVEQIRAVTEFGGGLSRSRKVPLRDLGLLE